MKEHINTTLRTSTKKKGFEQTQKYKGGGGGGNPDPLMMWGEGRPQKKFFSPLQASVWSKNRGQGVAGPPGASPVSDVSFTYVKASLCPGGF